MNSLISLAIISCLVMMMIFGGTFVTADYHWSYLLGFVIFASVTFALLYVSERRTNPNNPQATLFNKILYGFVGGAVFAATIAFVYQHFGRIWSIIYFSISTGVMYGLFKKHGESRSTIKTK